jgi:hypothetical protein
VDDQPLTLPFALRRGPVARDGRSTRTASARPSSKSLASTTRSAFPRQVHGWRALACLTCPPPFSRLCHQRAGFRRAFAHRTLARGSARPRIHVLFADGSPGPNAACRLLQSRRTTSTTDVPPEPRSPHARSPACETYASPTLAGLARSSRVTSLSRGQSAEVSPDRDEDCIAVSAPPAAIARRGSFTPTESARTPPVADSMRPWPGEPLSLARAPCFESARRPPLARLPPSRAASHAPPRRGARYAAPEVPSAGEHPPEGTDPVDPHVVHNLWIAGSAPFRPPRARADGLARSVAVARPRWPNG